MARVMIYMHNTPMQFWAKAINICYIANRILLRPKVKKTSYELWNEREPNFKYLRNFGSYILKDRENLGKFDAKSNVGIFLGYSTTSKAYEVYNQNSQII